MVIQTAEGFEALRCTGLNEALVYPEIPEGLSAKPTLSVKTIVREPTRATVTLSYLATGFDWQANYVADVSADGQTMNLFSWVTLANSDETILSRCANQCGGRAAQQGPRQYPATDRRRDIAALLAAGDHQRHRDETL